MNLSTRILPLIVFSFFILSCNSESKEPKKALSGKEIFSKYCVACHGLDGKKGLAGAKDLSKTELTVEQRINVITNGRNSMTPYKNTLSSEEIKNVAKYIEELKK